jgi:hypothetical protein
MLKRHRISDSRHHPATGVPHGGDSAGGVGELHQRPTMHVAGRVRVGGEHDLCQDDMALRWEPV